MTAPKRDARVVMAVRMSPAGQQAIAQIAALRGESPSVTMRAMLAYAAQHMPTRHGLPPAGHR